MSRAEAPHTTTACLLPDVTLKAVGLAVYSGNLSKRVVGAADFQKGVPMFFCGAACLHSLDFLGLFLSLTDQCETKIILKNKSGVRSAVHQRGC